MLRCRTLQFVLWAVVGALIFSYSRPEVARAAELTPYQLTPMGFIESYEKTHKMGTAQSIEAYAQKAMKRSGDERLARLFNVVDAYYEMDDSQNYEKWFNIVSKIAEAENNKRFIDLSEIYKLIMLNWPNPDEAAIKQLRKYEQSSDPIIKAVSIIHNTTTEGGIDRRSVFERLNRAYDSIPKDDVLASYAYSTYWYAMFNYLVNISDVEGAVDAAARFELLYGDPDLPTPTLNVLYRIMVLARRVDDEPLARRAYLAEYRLAHGTPTAMGIANLAVDCAELETKFQNPKAVLACLNGVNLDAVAPDFRKVVALSVRAKALAQLGRTSAAEADLAELKTLRTGGQYPDQAFVFVPLAEAQVLANHGKSTEAFAIVQTYWRKAAAQEVRRFRDAVPQLVGMLRTDVNQLRHTADLQKTVIALQGLIAGLAIVVALAAIYAVFYLRRLNRKLEAARLSAEQANQAKSQFLANISHEIRTPLNGVLGLAQAISADELTPVQAERIGVLRQSGLGLLAILNDLLDLAKIEAGKLTIEAVPFNPQEVLTAARHAIWATAEAKGLTVEATVTPEAHGLYQGDPTRLRQIIDNLVSNAVKFTTSGRVDVVLSRPAEALVLTIKDTGIGMSPEAVSRIFRKFEQADVTTTRRFGGTGLGLSICLELAEAMGGAIQAASVEGEGTTFTVILPLERLGDVPDVVTVQAPEPAADLDQAPLRVLAAEDHPVNQLVLRTLLGQFGVEVTMASHGEEVLALFKDHDWDVVLMDVQMPIMDGPTATRAIRQFEREAGRKATPILALTANAMAHQLDDYRQAGCNGHVSKPIDASDLIAAMSRVLAEAEEVRMTEAVVA